MKKASLINYLEKGPSYDEFFSDSLKHRKHAQKVINFLDSLSLDDLQDISSATVSAIQSMGVTFRVYQNDSNTSDNRTWPLDFIPRLIKKDEWKLVEKGLIQRVKALNFFIEDCYNERRFLKEFDIGDNLVIETSAYKKYCQNIKLKEGVWSHICGSDLIKGEDGEFYVLEDNLRVPSGVSYMLENRMIMKRVLPELFRRYGVNPVDDYPSKLYETLASISFSKAKHPEIVLLTPGIYNSAYFEHAYLAQQMGIDLVEGSDLQIGKDGYVFKKTIEGLKRVDVIYRRIDDDYLDPEAGNPDSTLGVRGLIKSWAQKKVSIVNAPGCGIADDKAVYSYVPKMIKFYLKEKPILKNIKTYFMNDKKSRDKVRKDIKSMVIKPVSESGGYGIVIGKNLKNSKDIEATFRKIRNNPRNYVAQKFISLSTSPTFSEGKIEPRHLDLRPFILSGTKNYVTVGGLTRVALKKGTSIVNSSQGGGSKDTWIID